MEISMYPASDYFGENIISNIEESLSVTTGRDSYAN